MKKLNSKAYKLLLRSLDSPLKPKEQAKLEAALAASPALRAEKEKLMLMRQTISEHKGQFQPFFTGKLIQRIRDEAQNVEKSLNQSWSLAFRSIAMPGLALVIVLLAAIYITEQSLSLDTLSGVSSLPVDDLMTRMVAAQ